MTIDEILAAMPEPAAEGDHEYLVIDPVSRTISVPESEAVFAVTGDENADRKYFLCPRIVGDGLDLAGMFIRVNFRNANGEEDGYLVNDVAVSGDYITFSWLLSAKVAAYMGAIQFGVCADLPNTSDRKMPDWNTTTASGEVLQGLHPDLGDVEAETSDVVTQLREEIAASTAAVTACGAEQVQVVKDTTAAETADAVAAVKAQAEASRASIPADYSAMAAKVDTLTRDRAAAIVCAAEGEAVQIQDASNDPLLGLRIFGRSTQDGTPSPDNPVEIVSLAAPVVRVCGKNLFENVRTTTTQGGLSFTVNADKSVIIDGTATEDVFFYMSDNTLLTPGAYHLSGTPAGGSTEKYYMYLYPDYHSDQDGRGYTFTVEKPTAYSVRIFVAKGTACSGVVFRPQIERGDVATEYEPGTTRLLTVTTPGSLPGIPVASGGNYTDANGQQWICDEVDLAHGVYVQRIIKQTITDFSASSNYLKSGGFTEGNIWLHANVLYATGLSDCFIYAANGNKERFAALGSGAVYFVVSGELTLEEWRTRMAELAPTIMLALQSPVEHALTDAELQAFRALHSYKPTTTVLNDAGAHMALEYAADPKTYIDNKLAALVAANG